MIDKFQNSIKTNNESTQKIPRIQSNEVRVTKTFPKINDQGILFPHYIL